MILYVTKYRRHEKYADAKEVNVHSKIIPAHIVIIPFSSGYMKGYFYLTWSIVPFQQYFFQHVNLKTTSTRGLYINISLHISNPKKMLFRLFY